MGGVLLNPRTGKPELPEQLREGFGKPEGAGPGVVHTWINPEVTIPPHIQASLDRASELKGIYDIRCGMQAWEEAIYAPPQDGAAISATTTETIMVPNFIWPNAGPHALYVGKRFAYKLYGRVSTVITTPGTMIFRLRWGGVAGTTMVTSKSLLPDTAAAYTNVAGYVQFDVHVRAIGTSGSVFVMGQSIMANTLGSAASMRQGVWPDVPAAVTIDTTAAQALSPTLQFSVATAGTAWTTHIATLEALN